MTPEQLTALEGVAQRALTPVEVQAISPLLADREDTAIAAILSAGRKSVQPTPIGIGTVLAVMAPDGGAFLNAMEQLGATDANVKWSLKMIEQATFDVGHPVARAQLQAFASAQPALAAAISALLASAEVASPVHYNTVSDALNIAEGRLTL